MTETNLNEAGAEALGAPSVTEAEVEQWQRDDEEGPDMNEGTEFAEKHPLVDEDEDLDGDEVNPYDIPVTNVDVTFLTNVQDDGEGMTLGEAANVAALNLIRIGLDGYNVMLTDRDTGRQWVATGGVFIELAVAPEEQVDATTD